MTRDPSNLNADSTAHGARARRDVSGTDASLLDILASWLPQQRWFAGSDIDRSTMSVSWRTKLGRSSAQAIELMLIDVATTSYQLLVSWYEPARADLSHALIGELDGVAAYDGVYDDNATALLYAHLTGRATSDLVTAEREQRSLIDPELPGLALGADQTNTSIVFGDQLIVKLFRHIEPGLNPDVELLRALRRRYVATAAPSTHVPALVSTLTGVAHNQPTTLALATEFFANSADGWSMASASVRDLMREGDLHADEVGGDFAAEADRLGAAIATVHADLTDALGQQDAVGEDVSRMVSDMAARAIRVCRNVPDLAPYQDAVLQRLAELDAQRLPDPLTLQRIHGDLHLGQVLRTVHGWVLIDFEGEPARPLPERRRLLSPLKDVAGMLRSLDYAAHQPLVTEPDDAQRAYRAAEWAERNRSALCDGYADAAGWDPRDQPAVLTAFELDKAIYEVDYEYHHRPTWLKIPLAAIARLTGR